MCIRDRVTAVDEKFDNYSTTATMNSAINQKANEISATISKMCIRDRPTGQRGCNILYKMDILG